MGSSNRWGYDDCDSRNRGHSRGEKRGEKRSKESRHEREDSMTRYHHRGHRRYGRSEDWDWNRSESWSRGRDSGHWEADEKASWSSTARNGRHNGTSWNSRDDWHEGAHNGSSDSSRVVLVPASKAKYRDGDCSGIQKERQALGDSDVAMTDEEACADAKLRLVQMRKLVQSDTAVAMEESLKRKQAPDDSTLEPKAFADVCMVFEKDIWDGQPSGRLWLKEWIRDGEDWVRQLQQSLSEDVGRHWCRPCWKAFQSDEHLQQHKDDKSHVKRLRSWIWKYGVSPESIKPDDLVLHGFPAASSTASSGKVARARSKGEEGEVVDADLDLDVGIDSAKARRAEVLISASTRSGKAGELLARAEFLQKQPAARAKSWLLRYRDKLTAEERSDFLAQIGCHRANDVAKLGVLQSIFGGRAADYLAEVADEKWVYKEPSFSWLSGFYWHPESTCLEQQREKHSPNNFCHLCEMDTGWTTAEWDKHCLTRRHAENLLQWAETMGACEHPSHCCGCPDVYGASQTSWREFTVDLEHYRAPKKPDEPVRPETLPPVGFRSIYEGYRGSVRRKAYLAISIEGVDRRVSHVRVFSNVLPMGPKDKSAGRKKRWYIDLHWCENVSEWKSLAIPVLSDCRAYEVDFTVAVKWSSDTASWDEVGYFNAEVPSLGVVALQRCSLESGSGRPWVQTVERTDIHDFVGTGQIKAAGGPPRGGQRPVQFATEDVLISFLLYVPERHGPHPLLMFFHGDMGRGLQCCPQPGLADFCEVYGPALMVVDPKKHGHPSRDFVVVTPCCGEDVWWLRHPALHDATGYVLSMELCLKQLISWTHELGFSDRERGTCFAGQSMGAYMALEIARAMPEGTRAVAAGAPCFDACRLDHLARRLVNVPVWLLIGRNDTMCSFEECASLALKMRDLDAKCIRLTSTSIKGHSEVGAKLEKRWLYEWLRDPLDKWN